MAYREVTRVETKEVLRQWLAGGKHKRIAARVGVDVKTVRRYVGAARALRLEREHGEAALIRKHDGIDLGAAIEALTMHVLGPRFVIDVPEDARAGTVQGAEALLRCAQEGVTNAVRHGRPTTITVACRRRGDSVELTVRDDSSAAPRIRFGNGLSGMRERLEGAGGRLEVGPAAGRGVELVARLPVRDLG